MCWEYFFCRPEDLKTPQYVLWVFLSPALIVVPVWNRSTRWLIIPCWDLTWRRCSKIKDGSHPCNPWSCDAPVKLINRLFFDSYLFTNMSNKNKHFAPRPAVCEPTTFSFATLCWFWESDQETTTTAFSGHFGSTPGVGVQLGPIKSNYTSRHLHDTTPPGWRSWCCVIL